MPLYEYLCDACGHRFEIIQKFSDPPVDKCPECGGSVTKQPSSPAIQFRGTGWYVTDYAKRGEAGAASSDKHTSSSSGSPSSASGSSASAPAASSSKES